MYDALLMNEKLIFWLVLVAGVYALWRLWRRSRQKATPQAVPENLIDRLLSQESSLTPEEAREWLDEFLLRQQRKI